MGSAMPSRRKAKVLRIGPSSLCVIIPKDWAEGMGLEPGNDLEVVYNGHLEVRPLPKVEVVP